MQIAMPARLSEMLTSPPTAVAPKPAAFDLQPSRVLWLDQYSRKLNAHLRLQPKELDTDFTSFLLPGVVRKAPRPHAALLVCDSEWREASIMLDEVGLPYEPR